MKSLEQVEEALEAVASDKVSPIIESGDIPTNIEAALRSDTSLLICGSVFIMESVKKFFGIPQTIDYDESVNTQKK